MSAGIQASGWPPPRNGGENATRESLEALASGRCTPDEFLAEILERFRVDRNGKWEVLSLLDQYFRRGKIKPEIFQTLKSQLAESALGAREEAEPLVPARAAAAVTAPAGATGQHARQQASQLASEPRRQNAGATHPFAASTAPTTARTIERTTARAAAREVATGDVLRGRYLIREALGHGGMGTVFAAMDDYRLNLPESGQRVAVKVLHTAVTLREELVTELQREFQHLQLLSHPNIVRVHEFDRDGDVAFFTMEALTGALLGRVLEARNEISLPRQYALAIVREIGAALAYAHSRGVIHGDMSPHNIFLTNDGELRVLDFGASHRQPPNTWNGDAESVQRTPFATPGYASSQQLEGQRPDARDDLFAFACVTYVLLTGTHPFPNLTAIEAQARRWRPRRPARLTGHQWRVLREGLRWDRERRPSNVQQWLDDFDLRGAAPRLPPLPELLKLPQPRQRRLIPATVAILALLIAGGYWAMTDSNSIPGNSPAWANQARSTLTAAGGYISGLFGNRGATSTNESQPAPPDIPQQTPPSDAEQAATVAPATPLRPTPPAPANVPAAAATQSTHSAANGSASPPTSSGAQPPLTQPLNHAGSAGPVRIELVGDTVEVPVAETTARVTVRRKGNMHGEASFSWWTESGTAKPGVDFSAVKAHVETIADGASSVSLNIPVSNTPRTQPKSFYVVIDQAESTTIPGPRTLTMVTLLPPE